MEGASTTLTNVDVVNVGATFTSLGLEEGGGGGMVEAAVLHSPTRETEGEPVLLSPNLG